MTPAQEALCNPVEIRGVRYHSQGEACRVLGIHPSTLHKALEEGRLDTVGLWGRAGKPKRTVLPDGREFESRAAAARGLGICITSLDRKIRKMEEELDEQWRRAEEQGRIGFKSRRVSPAPEVVGYAGADGAGAVHGTAES